MATSLAHAAIDPRFCVRSGKITGVTECGDGGLGTRIELCAADIHLSCSEQPVVEQLADRTNLSWLFDRGIERDVHDCLTKCSASMLPGAFSADGFPGQRKMMYRAMLLSYPC